MEGPDSIGHPTNQFLGVSKPGCTKNPGPTLPPPHISSAQILVESLYVPLGKGAFLCTSMLQSTLRVMTSPPEDPPMEKPDQFLKGPKNNKPFGGPKSSRDSGPLGWSLTSAHTQLRTCDPACICARSKVFGDRLTHGGFLGVSVVSLPATGVTLIMVKY